jgi:ATP-dependent Clp protease ATP-binding subunit ClpB
MDKFDSIVLGSVEIAQSEAINRKNTQLTALHLLFGLLKNPQTKLSKIYSSHVKEVDSKLADLPTSPNISIDQIRPEALFSEWVTLASSRSIQSGRTVISEFDLGFYLSKIFPNIDFDYSKLGDEFDENKSEVPEFLTNLNELAENGKLDPVIGRTKEIRAVMEILGRRGKNNPVLTGSAGVGKTAIVEGLADAIVKGQVPNVLEGKTVYSLNLGALMAGTKFRGEFEERIQALLKFMKTQSGEAILFIDEMHQLVGAGKTDGAMDAANLLKPALARGDLYCIGATTFDEYQKYILSDSALDRRFRNVPIEEPTVEDSIEILMGVREKFEMHHGIKISDDSVYKAVILSDQYITDKNLPDKAIDLVDEAAAALKISAEAMPSSLVELESEIRSKMIYAQVEKGEVKKEMLAEVSTMQKTFDEKKQAWEKEVMALKQVSEHKNELEKYKFELEQAERNSDFELASRLKYSLIPEVQKKLESIEHDWILNAKDIAQVISRQTKIPLEKILRSKQDHILGLESYLKTRVFGQDECLFEISETLISSHAGLSDPTRPLGSFLLKGPSGVGKTETAKGITEYLFNSESNLIRFDMSEFSEKHSVAKLIGAPAGYVGYDDGGVLTEAIRRHPYAVILFDEIEKAHSDFSDIMLQILDDGRLTDNKGRTINFKNTIILFTTNSKNLEGDFKPEVLGRIDSIIGYKTLDSSIMHSLINKQLDQLNGRLKEKSVTISLDDQFYSKLSELGYDERYGARPLSSAFNKFVVRPLSKKLLKDELPEGVFTMRWINVAQ